MEEMRQQNPQEERSTNILVAENALLGSQNTFLDPEESRRKDKFIKDVRKKKKEIITQLKIKAIFLDWKKKMK